MSTKPGEPHDQMVVDAPDYSQIVAQFVEFLDQPNTVVVGHNVGFDLAVLRGEHRRYNLDPFPTLPALDTMTLAYRLGVSTRTTIRLQALCDLLGVAGSVTSHEASSDVDATVRAFLALLHKAVDAGVTDIEAFYPEQPQPAKTTAGRVLSPQHAELHDRPTTDRRLPVADVLVCVHELCPDASQRVEQVATPAVARRLLTSFRNNPPKLVRAGEAGVFASILETLLVKASEDTFDVEAWFVEFAPTLYTYPRCGTTLATRCPLCTAGETCGSDTLHQTVAQLVCGVSESEGSPPVPVTRRLDTRLRRANYFRNTPREVLPFHAYMVWLWFASLDRKHATAQASNVLARSVNHELHLVEPRLALAYLPRVEQSGDLADVDAIGEAYRRRTTASTDPAFADLDVWFALSDARNRPQPHVLGVPSSDVEKYAKPPRFVRPIGRVRANKFKV